MRFQKITDIAGLKFDSHPQTIIQCIAYFFYAMKYLYSEMSVQFVSLLARRMVSRITVFLVTESEIYDSCQNLGMKDFGTICATRVE